MALPSGQITFNNLGVHFGDVNPINLSDYYSNASANFSNGLNVPSIGSSLTIGIFRGKTRLTSGQLIRRKFTLSSGTASLNLENFNAAFNNTLSSEIVRVSDFTLPNEEAFACEYTGWLIVTTTGNYTFGLTSDDGSDLALFYNNRWNIITSAYGYKPPESSPPVPGTVTLTAFLPYPIRIRFHEQGGGQALNVFWIPPGSSTFTPIPFSVFRCSSSTPYIASIREENFPNPVA